MVSFAAAPLSRAEKGTRPVSGADHFPTMAVKGGTMAVKGDT